MMWYAAPDLSVKSYILNLEIILVSISVCQSVIVDITTRLGAKVRKAWTFSEHDVHLNWCWLFLGEPSFGTDVGN